MIKGAEIIQKKPQEITPPPFSLIYIYIDIQKSYGPTPFGIGKVTILLSYSNDKVKIINILASSTHNFFLLYYYHLNIYIIYIETPFTSQV